MTLLAGVIVLMALTSKPSLAQSGEVPQGPPGASSDHALLAGSTARARAGNVDMTSGFIVYSRTGISGGTIWMTSGDGTFDTLITSGSWPRMSHDRQSIVFHGGSGDPIRRDMDIYDVPSDTSKVLFSNYDYLVCYDWSPDDQFVIHDFGCRILSIPRNGGTDSSLFIMSCYDDAPAVRPGGGSVAMQNSQLGLTASDLSGASWHVIPNTMNVDRWPAWSPDGQWISFGRATSTSDSIVNYYKIHPDGSGLAALTAYPGTSSARFLAGGAWTSDGNWLIVPGVVDSVNGIYAIATDGGGQVVKLATTPGDGVDFVGSVVGTINIGIAGVEDGALGLPPHELLRQNRPNPVRRVTSIDFDVPRQCHVVLKVLDITGRDIATLVDEARAPGSYTATWIPSGVTSGVYFYHLIAGQFTETRKLLLMH